MARWFLYLACSAFLFLVANASYGVVALQEKYQFPALFKAALHVALYASAFVLAKVLIDKLRPGWLTPTPRAPEDVDQA
ncbi:MAG: hypothetical protein EP341_06425 [Sphingomonadales bacterium]|nr:MAG: hypothetical protein EP341_06425 [Sphingomonadales bacterium]